MSANELTQSQKKEWAQELYIRGEHTQKEIADKVDVNENTITRWKEEGAWEKQRKTLLTTKKEQLEMLYDMLDLLNKAGKAALEDDDPDTNPDADRIIKITNAIKKLETDTGTGETIEIGTEFIKFVQQHDFELARKITPFFDSFIKYRLNSN